MLATLAPWIHELLAAVIVALAGVVWRRFKLLRNGIRGLIRAELAPLTDKVLRLEGRLQRLESKRNKPHQPPGG